MMDHSALLRFQIRSPSFALILLHCFALFLIAVVVGAAVVVVVVAIFVVVVIVIVVLGLQSREC